MSFSRAYANFESLWRLSWRDRLLILEAAVFLAIAKVAIAVLPFRHVGMLAALHIRRAKHAHEAVDKARRIRWAIMSTATRLPWRALCFQRGLAAQLMLRRRGVSSVLYYGAAQDDLSGLHAHVWVRYGNMDIVGGEIAHRFAPLATFPPSHSGNGSSKMPEVNA